MNKFQFSVVAYVATNNKDAAEDIAKAWKILKGTPLQVIRNNPAGRFFNANYILKYEHVTQRATTVKDLVTEYGFYAKSLSKLLSLTLLATPLKVEFVVDEGVEYEVWGYTEPKYKWVERIRIDADCVEEFNERTTR